MKTEQWLAAWALVLAGMTGCDDAGYQDYSEAPLSERHPHDHDHEHRQSAHEGKYGGQVLELDDAHQHHAEMLFDSSTRDITLYFYGSEIGVAKAATGLAFEIERDGRDVVLESKVLPLPGETEETASRFVIAGRQLPETIRAHEQLDGHFHVTIDGDEFIGEFYSHTHEAHTREAHAREAHADDRDARDQNVQGHDVHTDTSQQKATAGDQAVEDLRK